jgi:hypothetical protein
VPDALQALIRMGILTNAAEWGRHTAQLFLSRQILHLELEVGMWRVESSSVDQTSCERGITGDYPNWARNAAVESVTGNWIVSQSDMASPITSNIAPAIKSGFPVSSEIELQAVSAVRSLLLEGRIEISPRLNIAKALLLPELSAETLRSAFGPCIPQMRDFK